MTRPRSPLLSAAARAARPLGACLALLGACLAAQGAPAQILYTDADRLVYAGALAEFGMDSDDALASSMDFGIFDEGFEVSARYGGASSSASASQLSSLTPDGIQARGTFSAGANGSADASADSEGGVEFVVDFTYTGSSSRAYTVSASLQQDDANGTTATLSAFGELMHVTNGADGFSSSGLLIPGNDYTVVAFIQGTALGEHTFDGTVTSQSSGGTFEIEVVFATDEVDCANGFDDDGDGLVDDDDPDCAPPPPPEDCDNGIDDDGDGLTDGDDPDCQQPEPEVGLRVRCLHDPIYPDTGEQIRLYALAIDENGDTVIPDSVEIVQGNHTNVTSTSTSQALTQRFFTPDRGNFTYGCRATRGTETAVSWGSSGRLRLVDVGPPEKAILEKYESAPVFVSGAPAESLDIVFLHDGNQYDDFRDEDFVDHLTDLVMDGIFAIPWFVENQSFFNVWVGTSNDAEASPGDDPSDFCERKKPSRFKKKYGFAEAVGIVNRGGAFDCRAKSADRVFMIVHDPLRLQVTAHELGHALFSMADEYCGTLNSAGECKGFRFSSPYVPLAGFLPPHPNLYVDESLCRVGALEDGYDPDACRVINAGPFGDIFDPDFWIREPDYRVGAQSNQVPDLMQQTGGRVDANGDTFDFYGVGDSERERMDWVIGNCAAGGC